jgi:hypothetical protein
MSTNDQTKLKEQVKHIVNTIENGYLSKDNLQIVSENNEELNPWHIVNIETNNVLDNEYFETEKEAKDYLDASEGELINGLDYLSDVLDIEYVVNSKREYLGARVLVAFGGPNIWINTRTKQVEGYWWGDKSIQSYGNDEMDLDGALSELYNC